MSDHDLRVTSVLNGAFTDQKLSAYLSDGYPIEIGRYTYGGPKLHWKKGDFNHSLKIGSFCSIADDVSIFVGTHGRHSIDHLSSFPLNMIYGKPSKRIPSRYEVGNLSVSIGNDVWIGRGATIMAGISIGNGAVVASRAVVTKDVAPFSIVGGIPAKLIRYRFSHDIIEKIQALRWWDWSDDLIKKNLDLFNTPEFNHLSAFDRDGSDEADS